MRITARGLNRSTLGRQMLLERESLGIPDAIRRVVALQAQEPPSPYLALWNRVAGFDFADLDAAFSNGTIVKGHHLRITLHATLADDYPGFRTATDPSIRAARLHDKRFTGSGMTRDEADQLVHELLDFACQPQTVDELAAWLAERLAGTPHPGVWWALRQYTPLLRAPTGGPWSFGTRVAYVAPRTRPALGDAEAAESSLQTVALHYLQGFGPASVADLAQFALVQRSRARQALQALALTGAIERLEGPSGEELYDLPNAPRPNEDTPAPPRLLGMWDNVLLAYSDRSRVIPPEYRKIAIRSNGDVLPTLLVDGYVAGVWRATEEGIEATAFHPLPNGVWDALEAEAQTLRTILAERDPRPYNRFNHWWAKLPGGETRVLA